MSNLDFKPFYADGQRVMVGDRILDAAFESVITAVFEPDHEVSLLYKMTNGCAEIAPASIEPLPLNEDTDLVARGDARLEQP